MLAFILEKLIVRTNEGSQLLISSYIISDIRIELEKELFEERSVTTYKQELKDQQ